MTLSLNAMSVEWSPIVKDAGVSEMIIEGTDAKLDPAMLAQRLDVLPTAAIPEGEIDSDDNEASVMSMAGGVDDVSESDEAVNSEDDVDVTSVAARVHKIELSEQAVESPPEPHAEPRTMRVISEVASGSVKDCSHHDDEEERSKI